MIERIKRVFLSYAAVDEPFRVELDAHLTPLRREGAIIVWDEHLVEAGEDRRRAIETQLDADVVRSDRPPRAR